MRFIPPAALLLVACSPEAPDQPAESALYSGQGRDRLCIAGNRVGFVAYGERAANCSVRGRISRSAENRLTFIPEGDEDCRIEAREESGRIRLGVRAAPCAYYCGPGADFAGREFHKDASASPAVDVAGDPLC